MLASLFLLIIMVGAPLIGGLLVYNWWRQGMLLRTTSWKCEKCRGSGQRPDSNGGSSVCDACGGRGGGSGMVLWAALAVLAFSAIVSSCSAKLIFMGRQIRSTFTPLHQAVGQLDVARVKELLSTGADPNAIFQPGSRSTLDNALSANLGRPTTPERIAAARIIAELLLKHGADVNRRNDSGRTLLYDTAAQRDTETIQFLLDNGADPNIPDKNKVTIVQLLKQRNIPGDTELIELLKKHGAKD